MSKTARLYQDTRTANAASSHLDKLNDDLQDVTRIMTKNMEELLWRGDSLDSALCQYVFGSNHDVLILRRFFPLSEMKKCHTSQPLCGRSLRNTEKQPKRSISMPCFVNMHLLERLHCSSFFFFGGGFSEAPFLWFTLLQRPGRTIIRLSRPSKRNFMAFISVAFFPMHFVSMITLSGSYSFLMLHYLLLFPHFVIDDHACI